MTKEQQVIIGLLRKAINPAVDVFIPLSVDWARIIEEVSNQGVLGICFGAIELLPPEQRPDLDNLMEFLGQVEYQKTEYEEHRKVIEMLAAFYHKYGIKLMLLKGYGLSKYWPVPESRPVGDIDSYNFGQQKKADAYLFNEYGIKADYGHEHHTTFKFEGVTVENHYDIIDTKANRLSSGYDRKFKELASVDYMADPDIPNLYYPSATFNAAFLIKHMGNHFAGNKATLRQLLDWAFFMDKESKNVDWSIALPFIKEMGVYEFFLYVNAACEDYLGFSKLVHENVDGQIASGVDREMEKRIFDDIISPEFAERKDVSKSTFSVICFKTKRFYANSWKRKLTHKESLLSQLVFGCYAHLRRFSTIKD